MNVRRSFKRICNGENSPPARGNIFFFQPLPVKKRQRNQKGNEEERRRDPCTHSRWHALRVRRRISEPAPLAKNHGQRSDDHGLRAYPTRGSGACSTGSHYPLYHSVDYSSGPAILCSRFSERLFHRGLVHAFRMGECGSKLDSKENTLAYLPFLFFQDPESRTQCFCRGLIC